MCGITGAIIGGAALSAGTALIGSKQQSDASKRAANIAQNQFAITNAQQQPFMQSGYGAMGKLNTLMGINPRAGAAPGMGSGMAPRMGGTVPRSGNPNYQVNDGSMIPGRNGGGLPARMAGNVNLRRLLAMRAQNGDRDAARMMGLV